MADLENLLLRTSRTFALSIPRLPEPLRRQVTVAYLLFRVADTLEDADRWDRATRIRALSEFDAALRGALEPAPLAATWIADPPCDHQGYLDLLAALPELLAALDAIEQRAREAIVRHTLRTSGGMARFAARASEDGSIQLGSLDDLRDYCYVVAGIVGELLGDLFLLAEPIASAAPILRETEVAFGEGLQLVNILKDAADDARQGRLWLPPIPRAEIFTTARSDLEAARRYVRALQQAGASSGVIAFTALPVLLASATLDRVEAEGPGAKVPRAQVAATVLRLEAALAAGRPAL